MIRRPPRSTLDRSSAASDVYKRQILFYKLNKLEHKNKMVTKERKAELTAKYGAGALAVSYTHLRAHETVLDLVCRLLLEKKNNHHSDEVIKRDMTIV